MRVAYIYHHAEKSSYAGKTIALGFKHAFDDLGETFRFFEIEKFKKKHRFPACFNLLSFSPDIIFTSVENIGYLPLAWMKTTKIVLWGQFYTPCDYEPQIHMISEETKSILNKYRDKHDMLVWSQHEDEINEQFFLGYEQELGLKFMKLIHAADKRFYIPPKLHHSYDFIWTGNMAHRQHLYDSLMTPLKKSYPNFLEFNEHAPISPQEIFERQLYSKSFFAPNIHTEAQVKHRILVNERVFTSSIQGAFQICDNGVAKRYFNEDELLIAENTDGFREVVNHFRNHPEERLEMINKAIKKILNEHTYHHRINEIYQKFG